MKYLMQLLQNRVLWVSVFAWFFSCFLKGILVWIKDGKLDRKRFMTSGGMPSSHTTLVVCLAACVGFHSGFDTSEFVICCVLALVVMYDASGIRRAAGHHAQLINRVIDVMEEEKRIEPEDDLKEILGHKPIEVVAGAILGILIAILAHYVIGI